jgi:hypothetical protein
LSATFTHLDPKSIERRTFQPTVESGFQPFSANGRIRVSAIFSQR